MRMDAPVVERWGEDFTELIARVGPCFGRRDLRARAGGYVRGLLARVDRKNGWQLAEHLGDAKPYGVQRLLGRARWDPHAVRDEVLRYAREHLLSGGELFLEPATGEQHVLQGPRVGISAAAEVPWRFWIAEDESVSVYKPGRRTSPVDSS